MRSIFAMVLAGTLMALLASARAERCQSFEPATAQVEGTLTRQTFPGPPNYESVAKGDTPETAWLLQLDSPRCFEGPHPELRAGAKPIHVERIQLVSRPEQQQQLPSSLNRRLTVTGRAFPASTGHHHAPILLQIERVELRAAKAR